MNHPQREKQKQNLKSQIYDLLVIGGGVTGAGIALDAASRGLAVALVEKYDFASGTSSKSTKLIHGGLRYLKQLDFKLVADVGQERRIVKRNAPHLVRKLQMLLPVYKHGSLSGFSLKIALFLYEKLAGVKGKERFSMLDRKQVLKMQPGLNSKGLQGAALYTEYQADDSRLTIGLIKTAVEYGAECLNYCKVIQISESDGKASGAIVEDLLNGESVEIKSKFVVAAAGPWTDEIRKLENSRTENKLLLSKGVHLVFSQDKLPLTNPIYTDDRDNQRMYFLIPNRGKVYVGTTDTLSTDTLDNPKLENRDIDYLLDAVNNTFPEIRLTRNDIESSWAGIRPLIRKGNKGPSEISRKDEIIYSDSGLLSIAGGKLTGYRIMAKKVTDLVIRRLGKKTVCKTKWIHFVDTPYTDDLETYMSLRKGEATQVGFDLNDIKRLVATYGKGCEWIINCAFDLYHKYPNSEQLKIAAECHYAVKFEFVCSVSDFLIRRTGHLYYNHNFAITHLNFVADVIQELLNQSDIERKEGIGYFVSASKQALPPA